MVSHPLVSVCIPVFNGASFIDKCLQSCLSQTYTNLEIIICDDCSSDDTLDKLNNYVLKDQRIRVFKNTSNIGLVGNWNAVINKATGEYIKLLFQDDWLEPEAIEIFVETAGSKYEFVVSKRDFVLSPEATSEERDYYLNKVKKLENHFPLSEKGHYFSVSDVARLTTDYIALNYIGEPSLIFFKRSLLLSVGMYDPNFHQICDLEFNLRLASVSGVYLINKPICHFSIHAGSTTSSNLSNKYFRLRYIEQAYFAFKILNDSAFIGLKKHFSLIQKSKLCIYSKYRMHEAIKYISKQIHKAEFHKVLTQFPMLKPTGLSVLFLAPLFYITDLLKSRR